MMPPDAPPKAQAEASSQYDQTSPAQDVAEVLSQSTQPIIVKYLAGGFTKPEDNADASTTKPTDQTGGDDQDDDLEEEEARPSRVKIRRVDRM